MEHFLGKLNYLNSVLEGPTAGAIAGLTLTASNHDNAVEFFRIASAKHRRLSPRICTN